MCNDSQNDKKIAENIIRRGGYAGAVIAFLIAVASMLLFNWADSRGHRENNLEALVGGSFCVGLVAAALGFFAGIEGACSRSVRWAFIKGAVFFACAMAAYFVLTIVLIASGATIPRTFLVLVNFSALVVATGSLISGMAAIVVRDYRQFGRTRLFPQFSLQELLTVTTLTAIILSTMATMTLLRMS